MGSDSGIRLGKLRLKYFSVIYEGLKEKKRTNTYIHTMSVLQLVRTCDNIYKLRYAIFTKLDDMFLRSAFSG